MEEYWLDEEEISDILIDEIPDDTPKPKTTRRETSCIPGHLATPIYSEEVDFLIDNDIRLFSCHRHRSIKKFISNMPEIVKFSSFSDPILTVQQWVKTSVVEYFDREFDMVIKSVKTWKFQKEHFLTPIASSLIDIRELKSNMDSKVTLIASKIATLSEEYRLKRLAETVKDEICFKDIEMGRFRKYKCSYFERDLTILYIHNIPVLFPTSLVICALDKMQSVFGLKLYWLLSDIFDRYPGLSIYNTGNKIIKLIEPLRASMGQDFYSFISTYEPLIIGWVIANKDDLGFKDLFETQKRDMLDIIQIHDIKFNIDSILPTDYNTNTVLMYLELTGLVKIFGYPTLIASKLLDQLKEYGTQDKFPINVDTIVEVEGVMRRDFCRNYFKKHGKYPIIKTCPKIFKNIFNYNKYIPDDLLTDYRDWSKVRFSKTLEFDYCPEVYELVKDSATAVNLSSWGTMYDICSFRVLYNKSPPPSFYKKPTQSRRVIQAFLTAQEDIIRKLIGKREKGDFDPEDHICVQCGKECEQKPYHGRAFTKQTTNQRFIQTAMEHNIADKIFQFVPEQSMTDGELKNTNRTLSQIRELCKNSEFVCLDLKKWCLFQRHLTTAFASRMYDELFELIGLYENSHDYFLNCNVFCNSRLCPPDFDCYGNPIPGDFFMNNLIGGLEGMQQKKWTHVAVSIIKLAAEKCLIDCTIMGQGDNQVIVIHYKKETDDQREIIRSNFLRTLDLLFKDMNHELKEKETWYSKFLYEYGKQRYYKGIAVSAGTKKASRLVPDINDGLCSFHSSLSTINTMTEALSRHDYDSDPAFIINCILKVSYLFRKNLIHLGSNSANTIIQLTNFPSDFGGIPSSTYIAHSVRGHDDKITLWIDYLLYLKSNYLSVYHLLIRLWQLVPRYRPTTGLQRRRLYEDPYCLNVSTLPSAELEIKKYTKEYLQSPEVTNPTIKRLYSSSSSINMDSLVIEIDKINPVFPQLGNTLLRNSNAGILMRLQQKLTSSKTIEKIVKSYRDISLLELIQSKNIEFRNKLSKILQRDNSCTNVTFLKYNCSYTIAQSIREYGWNKTIVGLTKPLYQHQVKIFNWDTIDKDYKSSSILIKTSESIINCPTLCYKFVGPFKAYIGSSTKEKIVKPSIDISEKTTYIKALLELGKIRTWMSLTCSEEIIPLIDKLINEKMSLVKLPSETNELSDIFCEILSGNIFHRFKSQVEHPYAVINCLAPVTSHFAQSSNLMAGMTKGGSDYSIFYQYVYLNNMLMILHSGRLFCEVFNNYAAHFCCNSCTHQIESVSFKLQLANTKFTMEPESGTISKPVLAVLDPFTNFNMSYAVGRILATNVDKNYMIFHNSKHFETQDAKKESISLNDFRNLDLKVILLSTILFSKHCQNIMLNSNPTILSNSFDSSFSYLSEIILETNRQQELLGILDYPLIHHNMLTNARKLSAYIGRSIVTTFTQHESFIYSNICNTIFLNDDISKRRLQMMKFIGNYKSQRGQLTQSQLALLKNQLSGRLNMSVINRVLRLTPRRVDYDLDKAILYWRNSDRTAATQTVYRKISHINYNIQISLVEIMTYHSKRSQQNEGISVQPLSFLCRPLGSISSAVNKYLEIIITLNYLERIRNDDRGICCLAEGSGGTLSTLLSIYPEKSAMYNTLMIQSVDPRDTITDSSPPASVAMNIDPARIIFKDELASGETNILKTGFIDKLEFCLSKNPPSLVTMDAESMNNGTNVEFVIKLLPIILKFNPLIVIFKLFFGKYVVDQCLDIVQGDYEGYFYKPLSSNPIGREIFFIVVRINVIDEKIKSSLSNIWNNIGGKNGYLHNEKIKMSTDDIQIYTNATKHINTRLRMICPNGDIVIPEKYRDSLSENKCCGLICRRFLDCLLDSLDLIHTNKSSQLVYITIREAGTDEVMRRLTFDIFFLIMMLNKDGSKFSDIVTYLSYVDINDISLLRRSRTSGDKKFFSINMKGGNFWKDWGESKNYIRTIHNSLKCHCKMPIRRLTKLMYKSSVSIEFIKLVKEASVKLGFDINYIRRVSEETKISTKYFAEPIA